MRRDEARLAEAYESLFEEHQLQTYLHHHPSEVDTDTEQLEKGGQREEENEEEEEERERENNPDTDAEDSEEGAESLLIASPNEDDINNTPCKPEESDCFSEEGWTRNEVSTFFTSLGRRSRLFPDLISQDLNRTKSTTQVAYLLALLERACSGHQSNTEGDTETAEAGRKILGKRKRIQKMKAAHEVSDEWLAFEDKMAARLRIWQQAEDTEGKIDTTPAPKSIDRLTDEDEDEELRINEEVVTWDAQVLNVLLFLRHHPLTSPETNAANLIYDAPLAHSSSQDAAEQRLFYFPATAIPSLLGLKGGSESYRMFAKTHPVPSTRSKKRGAKSAEARCKHLESLAARIIFRGAEVGVLAQVEVDEHAPDGGVPQGRLLEKRRGWLSDLHEGRLIWLDTVLTHRGGQDARNLMYQVREAAAHRILNNLRWRDARIMAEHFGIGADEAQDELATSSTVLTKPVLQSLQGVERSTKVTPEQKGWMDSYLAQANYSLLSYPEKNRLRSRVYRRIQLYGIEQALAMPIDAQTAGRKRKTIDTTDEQKDRSLEREMDEFDMHEEQVGQIVPPAAQPPSWLGDGSNTTTSMILFKRADVGPALVTKLLYASAQDALRLFNMSKLKNITQLQASQAASLGDRHDLPINLVSQETLASLYDLLKEFVLAIVSTSLEIASLAEGKWVTTEHVKMGVSQQRAEGGRFVQRRRGSHEYEDNASKVGVNLFRSDPPRFYQTHPSQLQNIGLPLQGLRHLSSSRSMLDSTGSVVRDVVISPADAFVLPISSSFAPVQQPVRRRPRNNNEGDGGEERDSIAAMDLDVFSSSEEEEESDIFDDSDQEREIQLRKEEERGAVREVDRSDGRVWDFNEKREAEEDKRWAHVEDLDRKRARRHERSLWAAVGIKRDDIDDQIASTDEGRLEVVLSSDTDDDDDDAEDEGGEEESCEECDSDEEIHERDDDDNSNKESDDDNGSDASQ